MNQLYDDKLLRQTFEQVAIPIKIGNKIHKATFTNAEIRDRDIKYVNSLEEFYAGDYVYINDEVFLITSEVSAMRHFKYRGKAQHCNATIPQLSYVVDKVQTGVDKSGRPIYTEIYSDPVDVSCVTNEMSVIVGNDSAVNVDTSKLKIIVPDNDVTMNCMMPNFEFVLGANRYKVLSADRYIFGTIQVQAQRTV